ncbi:hypothetical protein, partial [Staphylococcus epidermidis]
SQPSLTIISTPLLPLPNTIFLFFHPLQTFLNNPPQSFTPQLNSIQHLNKHTNIFFHNYFILLIFLSIQPLFTIKLYK